MLSSSISLLVAREYGECTCRSAIIRIFPLALLCEDMIELPDFRLQACSSVGERFPDTEEVGGSIPPAPTIYLSKLRHPPHSIINISAGLLLFLTSIGNPSTDAYCFGNVKSTPPVLLPTTTIMPVSVLLSCEVCDAVTLYVPSGRNGRT